MNDMRKMTFYKTIKIDIFGNWMTDAADRGWLDAPACDGYVLFENAKRMKAERRMITYVFCYDF
jgi:hypothetical protein